MRRFACQACGAEAPFSSAECANCGIGLGFFPSDGQLLSLRQVSAAGYAPATSAPDSPASWRCLNFAWGCNWMLPADSGAVWCSSCQLTRGRPDETSIDAVATWSGAEHVKRRLVYQLRTLHLPIGPPSPDSDDGVVFDLVYLPDSEGVTGHRTGVVTLDLREVDDRFRETVRIQLGEPNRTVLGHLRHEIGHHYFNLLVVRSGVIEEFRTLFGDERADYGAALIEHYAHADRDVPDTHISGYATAHPSEDWAETFGHYLHLRDGLETADEFTLDGPKVRPGSLASMLERWRRITSAVNAINLGLGHVAPYPYTISLAVETKLAFVHDQIERASESHISVASH